MTIIAPLLSPNHLVGAEKGLSSRFDRDNSKYWGFHPTTADWIWEATDKMAEIYLNYIDFGEDEAKAVSGLTMIVFDIIRQTLQTKE